MLIPQTALGCSGSGGFGKGAGEVAPLPARPGSLHFGATLPHFWLPSSRNLTKTLDFCHPRAAPRPKNTANLTIFSQGF